jgi:hypothetical protein
VPPSPKERRRAEQEISARIVLIHNLLSRNGCRNAWEAAVV